ncbi:hypothetical protein [Pseudoduganella violacea]|uniref:Uncharacterized protein n=1 Tax=Pseudoduganella violacea TaxID=1715466 RepID=A0A7W5FS29_9BURK|nr:hypothetical protein [Pseudoduganella violacea]MBB3117290.1 hypothetical protein [Pseudoduganella violacea]
MKPIERFSLQSLPAGYPSKEFKRRLVCDGLPTWVVVDGDEIAAQFLCDGFIVLVTNYDYFDGVNTWIHLLDEDGKIRDIVTTPDYFGFLQEVEIQSERELNFGFYGTNDRWSLRLREKPVWSFRIEELRSRANRFLFSKRRLMLACTKGKPWFFQPDQLGVPENAAELDD